MKIKMHRNRPHLHDTAIYHTTDQHAIANDRLTAPFLEHPLRKQCVHTESKCRKQAPFQSCLRDTHLMDISMRCDQKCTADRQKHRYNLPELRWTQSAHTGNNQHHYRCQILQCRCNPGIRMMNGFQICILTQAHTEYRKQDNPEEIPGGLEYIKCRFPFAYNICNCEDHTGDKHAHTGKPCRVDVVVRK